MNAALAKLSLTLSPAQPINGQDGARNSFRQSTGEGQECGMNSALRPALAFTLIELLVVISIIAVLAGLTVGLSGVASRKSKESRIRGDLNRLVTLIENYKARLGYYPPSPEGDVFSRNPADPYDVPKLRIGAAPERVFLSQLFYELSGTIFTNPPSGVQGGRFYVIGRQASTGLPTPQIVNAFQTDGFANSARDKRNVRFTTDFKASEVKEVRINPNDPNSPVVEILVAPVPPPARPMTGPYFHEIRLGGRTYPWFYDSTSASRINTDGFDLWTIVEIGKKAVRFSNWDPAPVVVSP